MRGNDVEMGSSVRYHQQAEPNCVTFREIKHQQTTAMGTFLSVLEDAEFLQTSIAAPDTLSYPMSWGESDPFHSDWPYWDHICRE
jgi:hypothetical protein